MTSLAVTGATGFVGRHFVAAHLDKPDVRVKVLARTPGRAAEVWGEGRVQIFAGDLTDDASVRRFVSGGDTVVNLAYLKADRATNELAARNLAAAVNAAGARRLVHCSTAVVVGPARRGRITEQVPAEPRGDYQETKLCLEHILTSTVEAPVDLAILRPTEVFGPGGEGLRHLVDRVRHGSPLRAAAYRMLLGARRLNYVGIPNVVAALSTLMTAPLSVNGEVFVVSDDDDPANNYTAVETIIRRALGQRPGVHVPFQLPLAVLTAAFSLLPEHAPPNRVYDCAKLRAAGYRAAATLEDTINALVAYEVRRS